MEKQQKELLDRLADTMKACSDIDGVSCLDCPDQRCYAAMQALRRLVKKFYGKWQKDANNLNIDFVEWPELVVLVESIRDFDPMKEK